VSDKKRVEKFDINNSKITAEKSLPDKILKIISITLYIFENGK